MKHQASLFQPFHSCILSAKSILLHLYLLLYSIESYRSTDIPKLPSFSKVNVLPECLKAFLLIIITSFVTFKTVLNSDIHLYTFLCTISKLIFLKWVIENFMYGLCYMPLNEFVLLIAAALTWHNSFVMTHFAVIVAKYNVFPRWYGILSNYTPETDLSMFKQLWNFEKENIYIGN